MDCRIARRDVVALANRELRGARRDALLRHLSGCPACDAEYRRARLLVSELASTTPLVSGDGRAIGRMWQQIAAEIAARPRARANMMRLAAGAVVLTVVLIVGLVWSPGAGVAAVPTQPTAVLQLMRPEGSSTPNALPAGARAVRVSYVATAMPTPRILSNYAPAIGTPLTR